MNNKALFNAVAKNLPAGLERPLGFPTEKMLGMKVPKALEFTPTVHKQRVPSSHVFPPETVALLWALSQGRPVMIFGPKGAGKTSLPMELARLMGLPAHRFQCHGDLDPTELFGSKGVKDGNTGWEGGLLCHTRMTDQMLVLDEIDSLKPETQISSLGYLENLAGQSFALPGDWSNGELSLPTSGNQPIIATCNTGGRPDSAGHVGTGELNTALLDRFFVINLDYMKREDELKVVCNATGVEPAIVDLYLSAAVQSRRMYKDKQIADVISTRSLIHWVADSEVLGFDASTEGNVLQKIKDDADRDKVRQAINSFSKEMTELRPGLAA